MNIHHNKNRSQVSVWANEWVSDFFHFAVISRGPFHIQKMCECALFIYIMPNRTNKSLDIYIIFYTNNDDIEQEHEAHPANDVLHYKKLPFFFVLPFCHRCTSHVQKCPANLWSNSLIAKTLPMCVIVDNFHYLRIWTSAIFVCVSLHLICCRLSVKNTWCEIYFRNAENVTNHFTQLTCEADLWRWWNCFFQAILRIADRE